MYTTDYGLEETKIWKDPTNGEKKKQKTLKRIEKKKEEKVQKRKGTTNYVYS